MAEYSKLMQWWMRKLEPFAVRRMLEKESRETGEPSQWPTELSPLAQRVIEKAEQITDRAIERARER